MAANTEVEYIIRLKDLASKSLKKMGLSVDSLKNKLRKGLAAGLKAARMAFKAFAASAAAAGAAAAAVGLVAIRMGKSFLDAARNLEDTQAKFRAVFRGIEEEAGEMVTGLSESLGLGEGSVMGFMSTFQDTLVPMGFARDEAAKMSEGLVAMAADLAAFNPGIRDTEDAIAAMQSTMVGMNRSALRFAVVINEDKIAAKALELGLGNANGELTDQEKVMARLSILMEGTADAQGHYLRNQDTLTVQTIKFNEAVTDLREEMGGRLKTQLQEAINDFGGIDVVIQNVRIAFEFFANVLSQLIIPTVGNLLKNFGKFVTAMGGVDETVTAVSEIVLLMGDAFRVMWDTVKVVFKLFGQGLDTIIFLVKAAWEIIKLLTGIIGFALVGALRLVIEGMGLWYQALDAVVIFIKDTAISVFQSFINTIADVIESIGDALAALGEYSVVPDFIAEAGRAAQQAAQGMREFSASTEDLKGGESLFADISRGLDELGDKLGPTQDMLRGFIEETYADLGDVSMEFVDAIMEDQPAIMELFQSIKEGAEGVGTDYEALAEKVSAAMEAMAEVEVTTPEQANAVQTLQQHMERLAQAAGNAGDEEDALQQKTMTLGQSFDALGEGMVNFAKDKIPNLEESMTRMAEGAMSSFANGMTDALMSIIDGSKSAGEAFKAFAAQFLMDVARMIIQTLVFKAIKSAMGIPFADGGIIPGGTGGMTALANGGIVGGGLGRFMPVKGYATGGPIVNKPHVALIGEGQHNEAVVPLPDGRSIPVDLQGTPETQVAINIEAVDGASVDRMLFDRRDTLRSIISTAIAESRSFRGSVARA